MPIAVTNTNHGFRQNQTGELIRRGSLAVSGLTAAAGNTVAHGLPYTPRRISLRPGANGLWGETQTPDATNVYITVGTGGATAGTVDYEE